MSSQNNPDLTDVMVAEFGRLTLIVEAAQASNLLLQTQIDVLTERVGALEHAQILMKWERLIQDENL